MTGPRTRRTVPGFAPALEGAALAPSATPAAIPEALRPWVDQHQRAAEQARGFVATARDELEAATTENRRYKTLESWKAIESARSELERREAIARDLEAVAADADRKARNPAVVEAFERCDSGRWLAKAAPSIAAYAAALADLYTAIVPVRALVAEWELADVEARKLLSDLGVPPRALRPSKTSRLFYVAARAAFEALTRRGVATSALAAAPLPPQNGRRSAVTDPETAAEAATIAALVDQIEPAVAAGGKAA